MYVSYYELMAGEFVAYPAAFPIDRGPCGFTGLDFLGARWATDATFQAWAEVSAAELWSWCALATFLDPSTIPPETALTRWTHEMTAGRLFQDRVIMLSKVIECTWGLDPVHRAADTKRSLVRLADFRSWAMRADLPLPEKFPRPPGDFAPEGRQAHAVDRAFLREADMIPSLLPFSHATLWRKVKAGEFPPALKLSASVTAWRRDEVEAWLTEREHETQAKARKPRPTTATRS